MEEEDVDFADDGQIEEPAAQRPRGQIGGRRQQRFVNLINNRLASGELQPDEVDLTDRRLVGWAVLEGRLVSIRVA